MQTGEMEPPISLYMLDNSAKPGRVIDIQLSSSMRSIIVSMLRPAEEQREKTITAGLGSLEGQASSQVEERKTVWVYTVDHAKEVRDCEVRLRAQEASE